MKRTKTVSCIMYHVSRLCTKHKIQYTILLLATCYLLPATFKAQTEPAKTKEQPTKDKTNYYVNINIDIAYKDKDGNDLLDVNSPKHYTNIVLYKLEKGQKVKIDKPHMDHPNNQFIFKDEATKVNHLRVFLEHEEVLIQLDAKTTDTIKCKIKKEKGSTVIEKVWYNGKLEWEHGRDKSQVITIIKE